MVLDARDNLAPAWAMARSARWHRAIFASRTLALAAVVRFSSAAANRRRPAVRTARHAEEFRLPRTRGFATNAMDGTRARFRTTPRIPARRYLFGDRMEVHGTAQFSCHAALPMGAETRDLFRRGS